VEGILRYLAALKYLNILGYIVLRDEAEAAARRAVRSKEAVDILGGAGRARGLRITIHPGAGVGVALVQKERNLLAVGVQVFILLGAGVRVALVRKEMNLLAVGVQVFILPGAGVGVALVRKEMNPITEPGAAKAEVGPCCKA
jgi:hypothetical protein